jgi:DNA-binding CsgD family transcriptional regulator
MKERESAQILANILAHCYGVKPVRPKGVWEKYRRFMQQQWRLTDAQSRIAIECIKGHKIEVIALNRGISVETANKQLDAVYLKLAAILSQEAARARTNTSGSFEENAKS